MLDDEIDILHGQIVTYLGEISRKPLSEQQTEDFLRLMDAAKDIENIGDIIETDLVALGQKRIEQDVTVSPATQKVVSGLHAEVAKTVDAAISSIVEDDQKAAQGVIGAKDEINRLIEDAEAHQMERLVADEPGRLAAYAIEVDIIEKLKRIYYFAKRIAKATVPEEVLERAA